MDISHQEVPRFFVSDLSNPTEKASLLESSGGAQAGQEERKSLSSVKSLWDRQHPAKLSRYAMELAGLVQAKHWP